MGKDCLAIKNIKSNLPIENANLVSNYFMRTLIEIMNEEKEIKNEQKEKDTSCRPYDSRSN